MRVIHVIDHWGLGGAQRALVSLVQGRNDVDTTIAAVYGHGRHGWDVPCPLHILAKGYRETPRAVKRLRQLIEDLQPDLIQVHLTGARFVVAWALRKCRQRPPLVWYEHSGMEIFRTYGRIAGHSLLFLQRRLLGKVRAMAANSHHTAAFCQRYLANADVVYCPVDVPSIRRAASEPLREPVLTDKQGPVVGFVGRLAEQKNPRGFVKLATRLLQHRADLNFWVVGDGPLLPVMQQRVAAAQLQHAFTFWGRRDDAYALMDQMDVLVMPSRFEPFGLVACEGFALGVPVVGYAVDGLAELLGGHELGFAVAPDDLAGLVAATDKALCQGRGDTNQVPEPLRQASADAWVQHLERVLGQTTAGVGA